MGGIGGGDSGDDDKSGCLEMVDFLYDCGDEEPGPFEGITRKEAGELCTDEPEAIECPLTCYENFGKDGCGSFIMCIAGACKEEE